MTEKEKLVELVAELRRHAEGLPDDEKHVALEHVDRLHEAAASDAPDTLRMRVWLKGLEIFPSLMPIVPTLLEAIANVGA